VRRQVGGDARGWQAFLSDDELAIFWPFCAWREFGPHRGYDAGNKR
jgi:hypothetical protein